ncbi:hypothetical protein HDU99_006438, partial [Rhizoclosmatium hyalinum]
IALALTPFALILLALVSSYTLGLNAVITLCLTGIAALARVSEYYMKAWTDVVALLFANPGVKEGVVGGKRGIQVGGIPGQHGDEEEGVELVSKGYDSDSEGDYEEDEYDRVWTKSIHFDSIFAHIMLAALTTPQSEQPTEYKLQPLDTVLFAGLDSDPVSKLIKKITLHEVVPELKTPFHEIWTHAGILVDKTVLPIDCLEDGKMYILESGFSGEILGYVYSKILPVDHKVEEDGCHLGPQIRDFAAVVEETDANVGICPLTPEARSLLQQKLAQNPNFVLDIYNKYKSYSYPLTNPLRVVASASTSLHKDLKEYETTTKDVEEKDET